MITVYGKIGCDMCDKAKAKLTLLGLPFTFVDVGTLEGWREDGRVDFTVEKTWREDNGKPELPLLKIGEKWCDYPEAMSLLKRTPASS